MSFQPPAGLMVSVSGVRGRVGESLTPAVVTRFAAAFGTYLKAVVGGRPLVVVARDSRTSGPMFVRLVTGALQAVGTGVVDVGLVPTPTALLAVEQLGAAGGIIVTASHNPVEWNALKLASGSGMFLDADESRAMRAYLDDGAQRWAGWDAIGVAGTDEEAVERHIAALLELAFVDVDGLRARRFRVALDGIRGAGIMLLPPLLEAFGCEVVGLNMEPDGHFPRPPEPVAENLGDLGALVRETHADLGLATDPDGDRLALVDGRGRAVGEDFTLALAATLVLRHRPGPVVTNLSTSQVVADVAEAAGVHFERAPVGEINVARRMQSAGAVVGGEGNGGVILPDVHLTRDAGVAAALVLQLLLETGEPLEGLVAAHRTYRILKDKVPRPDAPLDVVYEQLEEELAAPAVDRQDGLWLSWPDERRWLHFRPSGTEPILRMIAEAPEEDEARALIERVRVTLDAD
ncbi:MAG: phosphoglucosamine mutase [Gemmatimonadota bacterium]|jgi:phosphomannomutase